MSKQFEQILDGKRPSPDTETLTANIEEALEFIFNYLRPKNGLNRYDFEYGTLGKLKKVVAHFWRPKEEGGYYDVVLYDYDHHPSYPHVPTDKEWREIFESFDLFRACWSNHKADSDFLKYVYRSEYRDANALVECFHDSITWYGIMEEINKTSIYWKKLDVTVLCASHQNIRPFTMIFKGDQVKVIKGARAYNSDWYGAPGYSYDFGTLNTLERVHVSPDVLRETYAILKPPEKLDPEKVKKIRRRIEEHLRHSEEEEIVGLAKQLNIKMTD